VKRNKNSKTFYLNAELDELIDELCGDWGTKFTKVVTAGLLLFLACDEEQRKRWMRLTMRLERKEMKFGEVLAAATGMIPPALEKEGFTLTGPL